MKFRLLFGAIFLFCSAAWAPAEAQTKKSSSPARKKSSPVAASKQSISDSRKSESIEVVNPGVFLLRDPLIQAELQLSGLQKAGAAELASDFNESIWRFRDASIESDVALNEARNINALIEPRLGQLLNPTQRDRLAGIILQVQGTSALSYSSTAQKLSLTSEQQDKISKRSASAQASLKRLQEQATGSKDLAGLNRQAESLQTLLQHDQLAVLTKSQRDRWIELRGAPFEVSKLQPLTAQAPELRGVNAWINSEPVTLQEQRGKVVVLHFWTFG